MTQITPKEFIETIEPAYEMAKEYFAQESQKEGENRMVDAYKIHDSLYEAYMTIMAIHIKELEEENERVVAENTERKEQKGF